MSEKVVEYSRRRRNMLQARNGKVPRRPLEGVKIKGINGIFRLDTFRVVMGPTRCAIYFRSKTIGNHAPSAIVGDREDILKLLDNIKVAMVQAEMTGKAVNYEPEVG